MTRRIATRRVADQLGTRGSEQTTGSSGQPIMAGNYRMPSTDQNIDFARVSRYLGWGDPHGHGLWFIGIEEGSYSYESRRDIERRLAEVISDGEALIYRSPGYPEQFHDARRSQVPNWQARIASAVSRTFSQGRMTWQEYRDQLLWQPGYRVFSTNLYALPKKSVSSHPAAYAELFGVSCDGFCGYYRSGCEQRHNILSQYWGDKKPSVTVCFGKTEWPTFRRVLGLDRLSPAAESSDGLQFFSVEPGAVILTPFFGRFHMTKERLNWIVEKLRTTNLVLP